MERPWTTDRAYRRRVEVWPGPGAVEAEMEDYCHHFRLRISHRDGTVTDVEAEGARVPWETCGAGANGARSMIGTPLAECVAASAWAPDRTTQCVHVIDLALVAVRHALDAFSTRYEVLISPGSHRRREAMLSANEQPLLHWTLDGETVSGPPPFAGLSLARAPFFAWIRANLPEDRHEPAVVLRRACSIGISRGIDLDDYPFAADIHPPDGSCYTYSQDVALSARRMLGSSRATEADLG